MVLQKLVLKQVDNYFLKIILSFSAEHALRILLFKIVEYFFSTLHLYFGWNNSMINIQKQYQLFFNRWKSFNWTLSML